MEHLKAISHSCEPTTLVTHTHNNNIDNSYFAGHEKLFCSLAKLHHRFSEFGLGSNLDDPELLCRQCEEKK